MSVRETLIKSLRHKPAERKPGERSVRIGLSSTEDGRDAGLRTDPELSEGLSCPNCGASRVTHISMTLTDGTPVDFISCHVCEHKHWSGSEGALGLAGVLDRTRKPR